MKYILIHEETCNLAIVEATPDNMNEMLNNMGGFNILRAYNETDMIVRYKVFAWNENGDRYHTTIYAKTGDEKTIFKELFPNDQFDHAFATNV